MFVTHTTSNQIGKRIHTLIRTEYLKIASASCRYNNEKNSRHSEMKCLKRNQYKYYLILIMISELKCVQNNSQTNGKLLKEPNILIF